MKEWNDLRARQKLQLAQWHEKVNTTTDLLHENWANEQAHVWIKMWSQQQHPNLNLQQLGSGPGPADAMGPPQGLRGVTPSIGQMQQQSNVRSGGAQQQHTLALSRGSTPYDPNIVRNSLNSNHNQIAVPLLNAPPGNDGSQQPMLPQSDTGSQAPRDQQNSHQMSPNTLAKPSAKPSAKPKPKSKAALKVIDLSSSDDEPLAKKRPLATKSTSAISSIPRASITLFGGNSNAPAEPVKQEQEDSLQIANTGSQFHGLLPPSPFTNPFARTSDKSGSLASHNNPGSAGRPKKGIPPDRRPEIPFDVLRQQQADRSSILQKSPTAVPRDPVLRSLEQQKKNGAFVDDIVNNGRSRGWSAGLGEVFNKNDDDAQNKRPKHVHIFGTGKGDVESPFLSRPKVSSHSVLESNRVQTGGIQEASAARATFVTVKRGLLTIHFKDAAVLARLLTPDDNEATKHPLSGTSTLQTRKRKKTVDLSADEKSASKEEDSVFQPSPPTSPCPTDSKKASKKALDADERAKNFGFKPRARAQNVSKPPTPPLQPVTPRRPTLASTPSAPHKRNRVPQNEISSIAFGKRTPERAAKKVAMLRVHNLAKIDEESRSEEVIREADDLEGQLKGSQ
jgi:hypothetical protein